MSARSSHAALLLVASLLAALALTLGGAVEATSGAAVSKGGKPAPSRLLVTAREFRLTLSRPKVVAGEAIVQLYNFGEDPHDLRLQRRGSARIQAVEEVGPGGTGELVTKLRRASRYRLWCSLSGHAELGMRATFRTTKRTARQQARRKSRAGRG